MELPSPYERYIILDEERATQDDAYLESEERKQHIDDIEDTSLFLARNPHLIAAVLPFGIIKVEGVIYDAAKDLVMIRSEDKATLEDFEPLLLVEINKTGGWESSGMDRFYQRLSVATEFPILVVDSIDKWKAQQSSGVPVFVPVEGNGVVREEVAVRVFLRWIENDFEFLPEMMSLDLDGPTKTEKHEEQQLGDADATECWTTSP